MPTDNCKFSHATLKTNQPFTPKKLISHSHQSFPTWVHCIIITMSNCCHFLLTFYDKSYSVKAVVQYFHVHDSYTFPHVKDVELQKKRNKAVSINPATHHYRWILFHHEQNLILRKKTVFSYQRLILVSKTFFSPQDVTCMQTQHFAWMPCKFSSVNK